MSIATRTRTGVRLGLRENVGQFVLLVAVNALVGGMVGQQQTTLPLLAEETFGLTGYAFIFSYIAAFGITKAAANYVAGTFSDRLGRKPVLLAGWLFAIPVPLLIMWAPSWGWIVLANIFLGINQGLTWSTTVTMKVDLVGPKQRGLAMGFNEAAGYGAVALSSLAAGALAEQYGLRPAPFLLGVFYTVLALILTIFFVRETQWHAALEAGTLRRAESPISNRRVFALTTWKDPALSSASQAGLVNNLNFGLSWGVFPLLFAGAGLTVSQIGVLVALYPAVWGAGQLVTGWLSDRVGRKPLITAGMLTQAAGMSTMAMSSGFPGWAGGAVLLGAGTALVYPALLAVVGDVAHPSWRGRAIGMYRVWRDLGYAVGAVFGGVIAAAVGLNAAVWGAAILSLVSAVAIIARLRETNPQVLEKRTA